MVNCLEKGKPKWIDPIPLKIYHGSSLNNKYETIHFHHCFARYNRTELETVKPKEYMTFEVNSTYGWYKGSMMPIALEYETNGTIKKSTVSMKRFNLNIDEWTTGNVAGIIVISFAVAIAGVIYSLMLIKIKNIKQSHDIML